MSRNEVQDNDRLHDSKTIWLEPGQPRGVECGRECLIRLKTQTRVRRPTSSMGNVEKTDGFGG